MGEKAPSIGVGLAIAAGFLFPVGSLHAASRPELKPAEEIHKRLWDDFIFQPHGLVLDYAVDGTNLIPSAEDCQLGRPNALSWWTPIENGAFFTGLYLDATLRRGQLTGDARDKENARRLMEGLLLCSSVGTEPGFIARGVAVDGKSHYAIGSDDQTGPWFYGLWRYLQDGAASPAERKTIIGHLERVGRALEENQWRIPCDAVGELTPGQARGDWLANEYRSASRLLFVCRILHELTRDAHWRDLYETLGNQIPPGGNRTRFEVIEAGMEEEFSHSPNLREQNWIYVVSQAMVRELADLEKDSAIRARYETSLRANAASVAGRVADPFPQEILSQPFKTDWKVMNSLWLSQKTVKEAVNLAMDQLRLWQNGRRHQEALAVREPFAAAWIVFLAGSHAGDAGDAAKRCQTLLGEVPWKEIGSAYGLFAEGAWNEWCAQQSPKSKNP